MSSSGSYSTTVARQVVLADLDLGVVHAGDDVRVGHQAVPGVEEPRALDAAAAVVGAADLEHRLAGAHHVGVAPDPLVSRADLHDPLRRERLEVAGEERRPDDVVEGVEELARGLRHHLVDLPEDRGAADRPGDPADPGPGDRHAQGPRDDEHGGRAERGAADGVDGAGRLPGDPVPDPGADELEQALPQRRREDHDEQRPEGDQQRRVGVAERDRRQPDAEQPAEQQPGGREGPGDEPLPVARQGVGQDHRDEQPVEEVHRAVTGDDG